VGEILASAEAVVVDIPAGGEASGPGPSGSAAPEKQKSLRFQFKVRKNTHESDADEQSGEEDEESPLTPLKKNAPTDLVRRASTSRRKSDHSDDDEEDDMAMPLGGTGSSAGGSAGQAGSGRKGKSRARNAAIPGSIDTLQSTRVRGLSAMSASFASPKNLLSMAADFGRQLNDMTFGPSTAYPASENVEFGGRRRNFSFAGVEMARYNGSRPFGHARARTEVPAGHVTQFSKPINPDQFEPPTTPRTRARKLSLSNYSPASPSVDAIEFQKWIRDMRDAASTARRDRTERKLSLSADGSELSSALIPDLPPMFASHIAAAAAATAAAAAAASSPSVHGSHASRGSSVSAGSSSSHAGSQRLPAQPEEEEPVWLEAIFIGTDSDFLESSGIRLLFKESALVPEDAVLFEMPEFKGLPGQSMIPSAQALIGTNAPASTVAPPNPEDPLLRSVDEAGREIGPDGNLLEEDDEIENACCKRFGRLIIQCRCYILAVVLVFVLFFCIFYALSPRAGADNGAVSGNATAAAGGKKLV
jgi:hypothetical protein